MLHGTTSKVTLQIVQFLDIRLRRDLLALRTFADAFATLLKTSLCSRGHDRDFPHASLQLVLYFLLIKLLSSNSRVYSSPHLKQHNVYIFLGLVLATRVFSIRSSFWDSNHNLFCAPQTATHYQTLTLFYSIHKF